MSKSVIRSPLAPEILASHEDTEVSNCPCDYHWCWCDTTYCLQELLETYLMDYNSLESKLEHLRVQIQSAEELVREEFIGPRVNYPNHNQAVIINYYKYICNYRCLFVWTRPETSFWLPTPAWPCWLVASASTRTSQAFSA
jgi:hypothetical protein